MCLNPKWITKKGNYKEDTYRGRKGEYYELGTYAKCGCCEQCQNERSANWVVRNYYESKRWNDNACFITLTYAKAPIFLVKKDIQDFFKRFRFEINKEYYKKLRNVSKFLKEEALEIWKEDHKNEFTETRIYYAGEYGAKGRAHFHAIIYGWTEAKPKHLGLSKSGNIVYQSKVIQETWGLGRTSYQRFNENKEAIYISLYETAGETFKKAYKLNREKIKQIRSYAESKRKDTGQYKNLLIELKEYEEELEKSRKKWLAIKEFNGWSIALGFEEFLKEYLKTPVYTFTEYIEDKEIPTPSPWLKKLANKYGDIAAAQEMLRREAEIKTSATETEERLKNEFRNLQKKKEEILEWAEKGSQKNGEIEII